MTSGIAESVVEEAALAWLQQLGYAVLSGPAITPGERMGYNQVTPTGST